MLRDRGFSPAEISAALQPRPAPAEDAAPYPGKPGAPPPSAAPHSAPPQPSAAAAARDAIIGKFVDRPRQILQAHLEGWTPKEIGARSGLTPKNAAVAAKNIAQHVGDLLGKRGFSPSEIGDALTPRASAANQASGRPGDAGQEPSRGATSEPAPVERVRDAISANLIDRPRGIFEARMAGKTPNEIAEQFGMTPEIAARASDAVAGHVENLMRERGIDPAAARQAVTPRSPEPAIDARMAHSGPNPAKGPQENVSPPQRNETSRPGNQANPPGKVGGGAATAAKSNPKEEGASATDSAETAPPSPLDMPNGIALIKRRVAGKPFDDYDGLRRLLMKHNVHLSIDPPFLRDDAKPIVPGEEQAVAGFYPLEGKKGMFYVRSDATRYEVLHELGHFFDWLRQGKPSDLNALSEQAAYDFLRNNETHWRSLSQAEHEHAHWYLLSEGGIPNICGD